MDIIAYRSEHLATDKVTLAVTSEGDLFVTTSIVMPPRAARRLAEQLIAAANLIEPAGCTMHPVVSSNIESIGHDGADLIVAFKNGDTYRYAGVPVTTFDELRAAKSVGSYLHANIRGKYEAMKLNGAAVR